MQRRQVAIVTGLVIGAGAVPHVGQAQIIPDDTLGAERSRVLEEFFPGIDIIDQGARRRENLFHSFEQFNVDEGRSAFFLTPDGIENIFSRVTGNSPSFILGRLGVLDSSLNIGTANLFFMNPNGIIFGPNSSLAIEGSFLATTADTIQFEDRGSFSAFNPAPPSQLLRINPSAFLFNQAQPEPIVNRSILNTEFVSEGGTPELGLRVPEGENLIFLGGDINIEGGRLNALEGRIELGGLAEPGRVQLSVNDGVYTLGFPRNVTLSDLNLSNDARVSVRGSGGGDIIVNADVFTATDGGRLVAGTEGQQDGGDITVFAEEFNASDLGVPSGARAGIFNQTAPDTTGDTGDVIIATSRLHLREGAAISTETGGQGDAGDLNVIANDILIDGFGTATNLLLRSALFSEALENSTGNTGNIHIEADRLRLRDGGRVSTVATAGLGNAGNIDLETGRLRLIDGGEIATGTLADGNGGNITADANSILIDGTEVDQRITLSTGLNSVTVADGSAGSISIDAERFRMRGGGQVLTTSQGGGEIGSIHIAADNIRIEGFQILEGDPLPVGLSTLTTGNTINAGNIRVEAERLRLLNGGQISTNTFDRGEAGDIDIVADNILVEGSETITQSAALSSVNSATVEDSEGNAGDINITTERLRLTNGGRVATNPLAIGNAGNIDVVADTILVDGFGIGLSAVLSSGFSGGAVVGSEGDAGNIQVTTGRFRFFNGGQLLTSTEGRGNAGNIEIQANSILIKGFTRFASDLFILSRIDSEAGANSEGNAGNITISAEHLRLLDGGQMSTSTQGSGDAGNINIAVENLLIDSSREVINDPIFSGLLSNAEITLGGSAGNISVDADRVTLRDGGQISTSTFGQGNAGSVNVTAEEILIEGFIPSGENPVFSGLFSNAELPLGGVEASSGGDAGTIRVNAEQISLRNGGQISTLTLSGGNAGDINVVARNILIDGFAVFQNVPFSSGFLSTAETGSEGAAGTIRIDVTRLSLRDGGFISTSTTGLGDAGDINIEADSLSLDSTANIAPIQSQILSTSEEGSTGNAGTIRIGSESLTVTNSSIRTSAAETSGGGINITAEQIQLFGDGDIQTEVSTGEGGAGNLRLTADLIVAFDDSDILAFAEDGTGGNILLRTPAFFGESFNQASLDADPTALESNGQVDVNAVGGVPGTVSLPDLSFIQNNLSDLPQATLDTDALLANSCVTRTADGSTFLVTGVGGLPDRPGEVPASQYPTGAIRVLTSDETSTDSRSWELGDPVAEPQGLYQLPDGRLVLSHECS